MIFLFLRTEIYSNIGKPRDEHDPKIVELNKHIDEVIDKVQQFSRTTSTTSNDESKNDIIK